MLVEVHVDEIAVPLDVGGVLELRVSSKALDPDWSWSYNMLLIVKLDHIESIFQVFILLSFKGVVMDSKL